MLIKRVVIQGFKTFAKKTEFVFDPGVTALVGPNGSGKSNVVDAIRWCMGEQSFSLLRSKKTSDIIFSGSDQKSRLGMAQVSLTLDNSSGELPVDFAEVEITRRAYRDGDNEYFLNGRRVRLQDTTEILAQTGLGKRTYALIGQGLIDGILNLGPDRLRALFEEAAGITSYQTKRTTTLRRLDATQQNLTRVKDIVAELSPRLRYLSRQAERAKERELIASDLRGLLRDWYGFHWHATLNELERKHLIVTDLQQRVQSHQQQLTVLSREIDEVRNHQSQLRGRLSELHRESSSRHRQAETMSRDLAVAQERLRQMQAREEESRQELAPLRLQNETLLERLSVSEKEIQSLSETYIRRQDRVDSVQSAVTLLQQERTQLQTELAGARQAVGELQAKLSDANSRLIQLQERRQILLDEKVVQTSARSAASLEATNLASALEASYAQTAEQQQHAARVREDIQETEASILALRAQLDEISTRRQQFERDVDRLQTRFELLSRLHNEGAGYASGIRVVLLAGKHDRASSDDSRERLNGIVGTIASLIRVPPALDKAVETALGGTFQNLVTDSWSDAQSAIEYLKRTGSGRATFLPLDRLKVSSPIPAPKISGVLGNAADLVQYDPGVADAVHQLLNRTWIVEKLSTARVALDSLKRGARPTVVTLDGEIVRAGGAVTGGSDRTRRDDSILARERELRELPSRIEKASERLGETVNQAQELMGKIETRTVETTPLQDRLDHLTQLEVETREKTEELRRHHDRAIQSEGWHGQRLVEIDQELAAIATQEIELQENVQQLTVAEHDTEIRLVDTEKAEAIAGAGDLLRQLADLRAEAAETQGSLQSQQALRENQQRSQQLVANQITAKELHIANLDREAVELSRQLQQLSRDEELLGSQIAALAVKIEPSEASLAELETQQTGLEAKERESQESLRKDESAWNGAQLQWQRANDRLGQLRHDIEQDLGLVFLEESEKLAYQPPLPWDAIVEQLPVLDTLAPEMEDEVREMRARLSRVNNVNPDAPREYAEAASRYEHLLSQSEDLEAAIADMRKVLNELDTVMEGELEKTFAAVAEQFVHYFQVLFRGGTAKLVLADPDNITNSGIEIVARPPGKRPTSLALLSGGERSLAACALVFAILRVSPTPFCVLDEVDAALDETNVDRFREALEELSDDTQFIIITHNRRTLEGTNAIYGITMGADGTSRVISLRLEGEKVVHHSEGTDSAQPGTDSTEEDLATIEDLVKL